MVSSLRYWLIQVISLTTGRLNSKIITEDQSPLGYRMWSGKSCWPFRWISAFIFTGKLAQFFFWTNHQFLDLNICTICIFKIETDVFCNRRILTNRHGILTEEAGCWIRRFITVFTTARQWLLSWARSIQSISFQTISTRLILIFNFYLPLGLPRCLFPNNPLLKSTFISDMSGFYRLPTGTTIWPVTRNLFFVPFWPVSTALQ